MTLPSLIVSSQDLERLTSLLESLPEARRAALEGLEAELARAEVVEPTRMPPNVVSMNSRVVYEDLETGSESEAVLVYPSEADAAQGRVSVLAPIGSALLGMQIGQSIRWQMPSGRSREIRVVSIPYQPEAAGDLHL